jgi:hypothetical protein
MILAAVLFAIAALGGVVMAFMRLGGKELPPMAIALVHGLFAASGLIALLVAIIGVNAPTSARIALGGFVVAALGGFALFSFTCDKGATHPARYRPRPYRGDFVCTLARRHLRL